MKHDRLLALLLIMLLPIGTFSRAQSLDFLLQGVPSAEAQGMGTISSTLMTGNALGTSYNPGYLGVYSATHYFNAATYTSPVPLSLPVYASEPSYKATAANIGLNLDRLQESSLPISMGLGYSLASMTGGTFLITGAWPGPSREIAETDKSTMYSMGIAVDFIVQFGIGITYKEINVRFSAVNPANPYGSDMTSHGSALSYGLFLRAPILDFLTSPGDERELSAPSTKPFFDLTTSFNVQNVGDELTYADAALGDPLPRNSTMGLGLKFGIISHSSINDWELVSLTAAREANDLLVSMHGQDTTWTGDQYFTVSDPYPVYDRIGGAIQVVNNVILGKNRGKVEIRSGLQLNLAEILFLRLGSIEHGSETISTSGFGIHLSGFWQLIGRADPELLDGGILGQLGNHVDLQFDYADVRSHELAGKDLTFKSLNIIVR